MDQALPLSEDAGYEAAMDILAQLIGYASDRLDPATNSTVLGQAETDRWRRRRENWIVRRRDLNPRDTDAVRQVLDQDGTFLRRLNEGGLG